MNHDEFFQEIKKNNIKPVYLFHGEEEYIKEGAYKALVKLVLPQFEELNISTFDSASADDIISACAVAPFMADRRIVLCRFMPKDTDAKILADYIEKTPDYAILIFYIKGKADGKMSLVKKLKLEGYEVIFDYLDENGAAKWIMQHAISDGCTINAADAHFMVTLVGNDMMSIKNELSKLCDYVGKGGVITKSIISDVVIKNLEFQLYNTYAYFINGKFRDGFSSLEAITDGKDKDSEAMGIAGYFLSCMKATLCAHDLLAKNAPQQELEAKTGKRSYALKDLCSNARKFTRSQLLCGIEAFSSVSKAKIMYGQSSYNALIDGITATFSHLIK